MGLVELLIIYFCVGGVLAVVIYRRQRHGVSAVAAVVIWPLWAPFALMSEAREPTDNMVERIDTALREGVEASRGTALGSLLSDDARKKIVREVSMTESRCRELGQVLKRSDLDLAVAQGRLRELEQQQAPGRALATARIHLTNVERLQAMRDKDLGALRELAQLSETLRSQLVLARFAGSTMEGAGAMVSELWTRVESLGEAMEETVDSLGGAYDARLGGR